MGVEGEGETVGRDTLRDARVQLLDLCCFEERDRVGESAGQLVGWQACSDHQRVHFSTGWCEGAGASLTDNGGLNHASAQSPSAPLAKGGGEIHLHLQLL